MAKRSLLLVDGDARSLRVLEVSLKKAGFVVTTAVNGRDALDKVKTAQPDLILSDTDMPEMDGFELCRNLKADPELAQIPFVFLTGQNAIENKIRGLELGVDEYLTKPIYIKEILTRLRILLQKKERTSIEAKRDPNTRFSGTLADMGVVDIIQTIEVSRKSGLVHFSAEDGRQATIYFRNGKVIDAECGHLQGEDAVYRLLTWGEGEFELLFRTVRRKEQIATSTQALLMEGMRRLDEWGRLLEQVPPLHTRFEVDIKELADRLAELPDELNNILRLFDGRRTLVDVIDLARIGDLECIEIISRIWFEGLVREASGPTAELRGEPTGEYTTGTWTSRRDSKAPPIADATPAAAAAPSEDASAAPVAAAPAADTSAAPAGEPVEAAVSEPDTDDIEELDASAIEEESDLPDGEDLTSAEPASEEVDLEADEPPAPLSGVARASDGGASAAEVPDPIAMAIDAAHPVVPEGLPDPAPALGSLDGDRPKNGSGLVGRLRLIRRTGESKAPPVPEETPAPAPVAPAAPVASSPPAAPPAPVGPPATTEPPVIEIAASEAEATAAMQEFDSTDLTPLPAPMPFGEEARGVASAAARVISSLGAEVASVSGEVRSQPEPRLSETAREIVVIPPRRNGANGAGLLSMASGSDVSVHKVELDAAIAGSADVVEAPPGLRAISESDVSDDHILDEEDAPRPPPPPPARNGIASGSMARRMTDPDVAAARTPDEPAFARTILVTVGGATIVGATVGVLFWWLGGGNTPPKSSGAAKPALAARPSAAGTPRETQPATRPNAGAEPVVKPGAEPVVKPGIDASTEPVEPAGAVEPPESAAAGATSDYAAVYDLARKARRHGRNQEALVL
ncbi:MAG TPA: DUF4388 domain-containing protein, partial [Kofleriaceae bacterium]|nr:DUF4388 domain-containing protein [Kofleriaceae bacterium]